MKKTLAWILAGSLCLTLLAGCAPDSQGGGAAVTTAAGATTAAGTSAAATSAAPEAKPNFNATGYPIVNDKITVTSWMSNDSSIGDPAEMSAWTTLEDVTNIHIDWTRIADEQVEVMLSAGDYPDFFYAYMNQTRLYDLGVEGGLLVDLNNYIDPYMPNYAMILEQYPTARKAATQNNGEMYNTPRVAVTATASSALMYANTYHLEQLNLEYPKTVDDFYNLLRSIANSGLTQGYAPLQPGSPTYVNGHVLPYLFGAFGDYAEPDFADDGTGKVIYNRTSDQYLRTMQFLNRLYTEKLLENEYLTIDLATSNARLKANQGTLSAYMANLIEEDFPDGKVHVDILPPLTSEYTSVQKIMGYNNISSAGGTVLKDSPYVEEICRMLDVCYAQEEVVPGSGLYSLSFTNLGIEGKDWEYTTLEDGTPSYVQHVPKDWTESQNAYGYKHIHQAGTIGTYILDAVGGTGNAIARQTGMLKNNHPYQVELFPRNFLKLTEDENSVVTNKYTEINTYVLSALDQFIAGITPFSEWENYCREVEKMGIADVLAAYQAAYDRWNS